mmetsp:Transcript_87871/g.253439  ORF Transcript_87871/g.253439 Transcript_87871/m.253439 type:complete len:211 (+) Transcript_87871:584-1216(+)
MRGADARTQRAEVPVLELLEVRFPPWLGGLQLVADGVNPHAVRMDDSLGLVGEAELQDGGPRIHQYSRGRAIAGNFDTFVLVDDVCETLLRVQRNDQANIGCVHRDAMPNAGTIREANKQWSEAALREVQVLGHLRSLHVLCPMAQPMHAANAHGILQLVRPGGPHARGNMEQTSAPRGAAFDVVDRMQGGLLSHGGAGRSVQRKRNGCA